jgi:hypothetical protein
MESVRNTIAALASNPYSEVNLKIYVSSKKAVTVTNSKSQDVPRSIRV